MKNTSNIVGNKIRALREYMGLTQENVASILNVGRDAVIRIEKGARKLSAEELLNFSKLFNISVEELMDDKDDDSNLTDAMFARGFNNLNDNDKKEILDLIKFKNELKSKKSPFNDL